MSIHVCWILIQVKGRVLKNVFGRYCFIIIDKFLITGKHFKYLKIAKEFLDKITWNHDATPAKQCDDVPTKLDVITVTNTVISG